ncbi:MAG: DUF3795 domain-containing protein, partial [Candidatus Bathyarchaeota archaeon]|nr:DUF3795 domain-containing protein [Candidatus Bathyarchaeota archaeon]
NRWRSPDCKIRICAKEKRVDTCPLCREYQCDLINSLAERYVTAIKMENNYKKRIKDLGKRPRKRGQAWSRVSRHPHILKKRT